MTGDSSQGAPDPSEVMTPEDLAGAAKDLMKRLDLTGVMAARKTGLSTGTISELINGKTFPREDTWEVFITRGCGQPWEAWRQARSRAHRDLLRSQPPEELAALLEEAQERILALEHEAIEVTQRLTLLEEQVAGMQSTQVSEALAKDKKTEEQQQADAADKARQRHFGRLLLAELHMDFEHTMADGAWSAVDVDRFVAKVRELALTDMEHLHVFLATTPTSFPYAEMGEVGYLREGVKDYMQHLRFAVAAYFKISPTEIDELLAGEVSGG
ncbi:hypothetical protein ACVW0K_003871 [Streptomyces filamentosus]